MKIRTAIATASAVALISGGGAFAFATAASASGATHTLKFISEQVNTASLSKTSEAVQNKDVTSKGKLIGFDELNIVFNTKTGKASAIVAVDLNGGLLFGAFTLSSSSSTIHGVVTGGLGAFKGASGTILAKFLNKAGTKTAVTVTYHT